MGQNHVPGVWQGALMGEAYTCSGTGKKKFLPWKNFGNKIR